MSIRKILLSLCGPSWGGSVQGASGEERKDSKGQEVEHGVFFVEETLGGAEELGLVTITETTVTIDSTMVIIQGLPAQKCISLSV